MLAKCKTLTEYEPKEQLYKPKPQSRKSSQDDIVDESKHADARYPEGGCQEPQLYISRSLSFHIHEPDFHGANSTASRIPGLPPKVPPDIHIEAVINFLAESIVRPVEQMLTLCHCGDIAGQKKSMNAPLRPLEVKESFDKFRRDVKGFAAIVVASI